MPYDPNAPMYNDDYLTFCAELGFEPDSYIAGKAYSRYLNLRGKWVQ